MCATVCIVVLVNEVRSMASEMASPQLLLLPPRRSVAISSCSEPRNNTGDLAELTNWSISKSLLMTHLLPFADGVPSGKVVYMQIYWLTCAISATTKGLASFPWVQICWSWAQPDSPESGENVTLCKIAMKWEVNVVLNFVGVFWHQWVLYFFMELAPNRCSRQRCPGQEVLF